MRLLNFDDDAVPQAVSQATMVSSELHFGMVRCERVVTMHQKDYGDAPEELWRGAKEL